MRLDVIRARLNEHELLDCFWKDSTSSSLGSDGLIKAIQVLWLHLLMHHPLPSPPGREALILHQPLAEMPTRTLSKHHVPVTPLFVSTAAYTAARVPTVQPFLKASLFLK